MASFVNTKQEKSRKIGVKGLDYGGPRKHLCQAYGGLIALVKGTRRAMRTLYRESYENLQKEIPRKTTSAQVELRDLLARAWAAQSCGL